MLKVILKKVKKTVMSDIIKQQNVLIAAAWPYANGPLHLGHLCGFLSADFLSRYHKLYGDKVIFVSGSDCYGTPILVKALQENVPPEQIAEKYNKEFRETLIDGLGFTYDLFSATTSKKHHEVVQSIFSDLLDKGYIYKKFQNLPYCENCKRFLADRYITGNCPVCGSSNARGDQCDDCGKLLDAKDVVNPSCKICGTKPVWKDTEHFFLKLSAFENRLTEWIKASKGWRKNAVNFSLNFIKEGLIDRAITRDSTWGVPIPLPGYEDKSIYVWFEAVSGYLSTTKEYFESQGNEVLWKDLWLNNNALHYYCHGKDNIPFHTIIWPTILMGLGDYILPTKIFSSEYLLIDGKQFSKSRGIGVFLSDLLDQYNPDYIRFYVGINGPENADSNFSVEDFQSRINSELIEKYGNLVNRVTSFCNTRFDGVVPERQELRNVDKQILDRCPSVYDEIGDLIRAGKFQKSLKTFINFASECNKYVTEQAPWNVIKEDKEKAGHIINIAIQAVSALQVLSEPFIPFSSLKLKEILNVNERNKWQFYEIPAGHKINKTDRLFVYIEK